MPVHLLGQPTSPMRHGREAARPDPGLFGEPTVLVAQLIGLRSGHDHVGAKHIQDDVHDDVHGDVRAGRPWGPVVPGAEARRDERWDRGAMTTSPALTDQVCFALYAASRATTNAYRPGLARLGLTYAQFVVLLILWEHDGLSVTDIARRLRIDASTLSPVLKRMESMGLVERRRSTQDERRVAAHLTPAGAALAGPALQVRHEVSQRLGLTPEESQQVRDLALRVVHTLEPDDPRSTDDTDDPGSTGRVDPIDPPAGVTP